MSLRSLSNCFKCILASLLLLEISSCTTREPQQSTDSTRLSIHDTTAAKKYEKKKEETEYKWPTDTPNYDFCLPCDSMLKMSINEYEYLYGEAAHDHSSTPSIAKSRSAYNNCMDSLNHSKAQKLIPAWISEIDSLNDWLPQLYVRYIDVCGGTLPRISITFYREENAVFIDSLIDLLHSPQPRENAQKNIDRWLRRAQLKCDSNFKAWIITWSEQKDDRNLEFTMMDWEESKRIFPLLKEVCNRFPPDAGYALAKWIDYSIREAEVWPIGDADRDD